MNISRNGWSDALDRMQTATSALALAAVFALQGPAALIATSRAEAKTPGKTYCYYGHCHRVRTIEETRRAIGVQQTLKASFYDDPKKDRYNPSNITSSGEFFRSDRADNAASPIWPDGTKMLLWNPANKRTAVVRINNAGPYWGLRQLDVSRAAAEKLGFVKSGVATLQTRVLAAPTPAEATYRKGRNYAPVPGFMGVFDTIDTALLEVGRSIHNIFAPPTQAVAGREAPAATKSQRVAEAAAAKATPAANSEPKAAKVERKPEPKVAAAAPKPAPKPEVKVAKAEPKPAVKVAKPQPKPEIKVAKVEPKPAVAQPKASVARLQPQEEAEPRQRPARIAATRATIESDDDEDRPVRRRIVRSREVE